MLILIAACLPAFVLAAILWRGAWKINEAKTGYFAASVPVAALIGLTFWLIGTHTSTSFAEVWSYKIKAVRFYEFWNERVACRHPIYETRYRTVTHTRTNSKGRTETYTTTESYQVIVGHWHAYDVDDHPAHWEALDEYGSEHPIDASGFATWKANWSNSHWINLHRSYHTIDGNLWQSDWPGDFNGIFPWSDVHSYENRVRVCASVFNTVNVDDATRKKYLRPADVGDTSVLHGYGVAIDGNAEWMFRRLNAEYGPTCKIHNIVMLFDANQYGRGEIERLKAAWQGPNKNELVTCIGIGAGGKIVWCDVFSWMDDTTIHSLIRQDVSNLGTYDPNRVLDVLKARIPAYWKKKNFHDFDYLGVSCPAWAHATAYALVFAGAVAWAWFIQEKMDC